MNILKGLIFGQCLGDAVGLITEFQRKGETKKIEFPYKYNIRDWPICDWTDDSDQMLLLLELIIQHEVTAKKFAEKLLYWKNKGFPELGDIQGRGIGGTTMSVVNDPCFLENPKQVAKNFWIGSGKTIAANGALMRTSILSICDNYLDVSKEICQVTHADPRCIASCLVLNEAISLIMKDQIKDLKKNAVLTGIKYFRTLNNRDRIVPIVKNKGIPHNWINKKYIYLIDRNSNIYYYDYERELLDYSNFNCHANITEQSQTINHILDNPHNLNKILSYSLSNLELDKQGIGYTYKCLGCAMWTMDIIEYDFLQKQHKSSKQHNQQATLNFKNFIKAIVLEAGDADTNAACVGALLGTYIGYKSLYEQAEDWINAMPNTQWLHDKIDNGIKMRL